jgi:hypothetical protein
MLNLLAAAPADVGVPDWREPLEAAGSDQLSLDPKLVQHGLRVDVFQTMILKRNTAPLSPGPRTL